jgi:hypothetical protein
MPSKKKPENSSQRDGRVTQRSGSAFAEAGRFIQQLIGLEPTRTPAEKSMKGAGRSLGTPGGNPFTLLNVATESVKKATRKLR